jgi:hypothetical protein
MTKRLLIIISLIVVIVAGRYIYKAIYPPIVAVDPVAQEVEVIKQEVIKDRIIIKEVIRDAQQTAVERITVMPDDVVADELNSRLDEYRKRRSGTTE